MPNECQVWVNEIREIFPSLDKYFILACYGDVPKNSLTTLISKVVRNVKKTEKRARKLRREYEIILSKELKRIKDLALRRQVILYTMITELMLIEKRCFLKPYGKIKKRKVNLGLLENESLGRYNLLRKRVNLPEIRNIQDMNLIVNGVLKDIGLK